VRWLLTCLAALLGGCDAITPVTASPAPINACTVAADCSGYPADAGPVGCFTIGNGLGACQTDSLGSYLLVVTVPTLAPVAAGATYALTSDTLFTTKSVNAACAVSVDAGAFACFKLPPLAVAEGTYVVTEAEAEAIRSAVNVPGVTNDVSLPVAATFWPEWTAPGASGPVDVRYLNLPLPPVVAAVGGDVANLQLLPPAYPPGEPTAPNVTNTIEWIAGVPPLQESAPYNYDAVVHVFAPFNDGYPDQSYQAVPDHLILELIGTFLTPVPAVQPLNVARSDGKPLGAGWTLYLRDANTFLPLSSRVTLTDEQTLASVNVLENAAKTEVDFVLDPPPGSILPELVQENDFIVSGLVPIQQLPPLPYPVLPPIVHVSGTVRSAAQSAVSSTLLFYSTDIESLTACQAKTTGLGANLFYEAVVSTADERSANGEVGNFSVDLPHGTYAVVIQPSPASGYAKSIFSYLQVPAQLGDGCTGAPLSMTGTTIVASDPITLTGHVVTADGRPVANAAVDFTPSAAFAPSLNPSASPGGVPFASVIARDRWPRPFTTTTGAQGGFSIQVDRHEDKGSDPHYDVTVRPQDGTAFPWTVRPDHIYHDNQSIEIVVPPPSFVSLTLHDPSDTPLANAVVQAYTFTTVTVPPTPANPTGTTSVAIPIGQAMTDATGYFGMMLTTRFAP
jgi:hypothetical protein